MGNYFLPETKAATSLLSELTGKKIEIKTAAPWAPPATQALNVAAYITDTREFAVACLCDMALGGSIAAALTRIPMAIVNESVKAGKLAEGLFENLREVLNVCASLLNAKGFPHLALRDLKVAPPIPEEIAKLIATPSSRVDLEISVESYGGGRMSFFAL